MQRPRSVALAFALSLFVPCAARAFCGFYVGKAGAELFNDASQVVLARDGNRTIVTMSNDFKGTLTEFALVVPVPAVISKDQVHIGERKFIERVDAYSSPRLVEYHDSNPCEVRREMSYKKGINLIIEGSLQQRKFTPRDGSERTVHEIVVHSCHVIGSTTQLPANSPVNGTATPVIEQDRDDEDSDVSWPL